MTNILPCPFCGKLPVMLETCEDDSFSRCFEVRCDNCGIGLSEEYRDQTIDLWNTRRPAPDTSELVKVLTRAVDYYDGLDRLHNDGEAEVLDQMAAVLKAATPAPPIGGE